MATIRQEIALAAINRAFALVDHNIQNNLEHVSIIQTVLADKSLTKDEKSYAVKILNEYFDYFNILYNKGTKRICENCHDECLATLYCEHCIRNYLKENFSNWTSGNNDIDNLIQQCQIKALTPDLIVEWIPYNNLQNIKYLTKGGCSEIYTADWIDGRYEEWDLKEKQLKRYGSINVVLKKLENVESANKSWFDEVYTVVKSIEFFFYNLILQFLLIFIGYISSTLKQQNWTYSAMFWFNSKSI
jgi:hypothetical protein